MQKFLTMTILAGVLGSASCATTAGNTVKRFSLDLEARLTAACTAKTSASIETCVCMLSGVEAQFAEEDLVAALVLPEIPASVDKVLTDLANQCTAANPPKAAAPVAPAPAVVKTL